MAEKLQLHSDLRLYARVRLGNLRVSGAARALFNAGGAISCAFFVPPAGIVCTQLAITGRGGAIPAWRFSPKDLTPNAPCLLYFHGGGFITRDYAFSRRNACRYAQLARCHVVYIRYRLAPKHPFPIPFHDCLDSYLWLQERAAALGIDVGRIAVGGDSAGGALAAAVCLYARDSDSAIPLPCFQMLLYPALDARQQTDSMRTLLDIPGCNPHFIRQMWAQYLKNGDCGMPQYASPSLAKTLRGLPPAYIEIEQYDCLRDEGAAYAARLREDGVAATLCDNAGTFHAFEMAAHTGIAQNTVAARAAALRAAFDTGSR